MAEEKPVLSISDKGIEMNLKKGDSIITNADKIFMQNTKQNADSGIIKNNAKQNLTQIGNTMNAFNGGKIINKVEANNIIENKTKIGILNQGENNSFIDNTFKGHDIGIKDEGKNTIAKGNKFLNNENTKVSEKMNFKSWFLKNLEVIIIGVIIVLIGGFLLYKLGWNK